MVEDFSTEMYKMFKSLGVFCQFLRFMSYIGHSKTRSKSYTTFACINFLSFPSYFFLVFSSSFVCYFQASQYICALIGNHGLLQLHSFFLFEQVSSTFYTQGRRMRLQIGNFVYPVSFMQTFGTIIVLLFIPLTDKIIYPWLVDSVL